jgi:hypothetical protein
MMVGQEKLSKTIDDRNDTFTSAVRQRLLGDLSSMDEKTLEWLVMEHYQFSLANRDVILLQGVESTASLANKGVTAELQRNADEEDGHAPMYKQAMRDIGTDMDQRVEFPPTTRFLSRVTELSASNPSRSLGALYATETAAIFEHEAFYEISREIAERRGYSFEGSLIKHFHDLHLDGGVEQGHKDGLAAFVDVEDPADPAEGERIDKDEVHRGAMEAIEAMREWWDALLGRAFPAAAAH